MPEAKIWQYNEIIEEIQKNGDKAFKDLKSITGSPRILKRKITYHIIRDNTNYYFKKSNDIIPSDDACIILSEINIRNDIYNKREIPNLINCSDWIFFGKVNLIGNVYQKKVNINYATFLDELDFSHSNFNGRIDSRATLFYEKTFFSISIFNDITDFSVSEFHSSSSFDKTTFNSIGIFSDIKFKMYSDFSYAVFFNTAIFKKTIFTESVSFGCAIFNHEVDYSMTSFLSQVIFIKSKFKSTVDFIKINTEKDSEIDFMHTIFYERVNFSESKIHGKIKFEDTTIKDVFNIPYYYLKDMKENRLFFAPLIIRNKENEIDNYSTMNNFRTISDIYKRNGQLEYSINTYYNYKKYERLFKYKQNLIQKFISWLFLDLGTKYFTSWKRIILIIFSIIVIGTITYCSAPYINQHISIFGKISSIELPITFHQWIKYIGKNFYFSLITFTTIGYGDIHPTGFVRIIAGFEGLLGIFMSSMFIVTLAKRVLG